ncbi:MAG: TetR/AcrR family transcriptional regulator [Bacillota bacterium]
MTQDRRVLRTKKALETAFLDLIHVGSYQDITILAICEKADYTRGAFYSHFNSKEDLFHQIIEHRLETLLKELKGPYMANRQLLKTDMLHPAALVLFDHIYNNRNFYQLLQHPAFKQLLQEKLVNKLIHHFLFDLSFEYPENTPPIEQEIKAYHLAYATLGVIYYWIDQEFRFSSQYMAEELMKIATTPLFSAHYSAAGVQRRPPL